MLITVSSGITVKDVYKRQVLNQDIVFQYLMNGKKGDQWLNRKQNTVELFKLPTYQIWQENERSHCYQQYTNDERYVICGGAYPIICLLYTSLMGNVMLYRLQHFTINKISKLIMSEWGLFFQYTMGICHIL